MRKIKAKEPRLPRDQQVILVQDPVAYNMIRLYQWEEHQRRTQAAQWAEGLRTFQKRFGVIES